MPRHTVHKLDSNSPRRSFLCSWPQDANERGPFKLYLCTWLCFCCAAPERYGRNAYMQRESLRQPSRNSVNGFLIRVVPHHAHVFVQFAGSCGFLIRGVSARVLVKCARSYGFPIRAGHQGMSLDVSGNGACLYGFPSRAGQPALGVNGPS